MTPKLTLLLCTVREDTGYITHPEWTTLGKIMDDLDAQTFKDFELVIVDGLHAKRAEAIAARAAKASFHTVHIPPDLRSPWVRQKRVAISAYRNSGLARACGDLVVNLDDAVVLPPNYVETFWLGWSRHGYCLAATWPRQNDHRQQGIVTAPGQVYGFGSYPLAAALELNGYDEAYDGAQGLEDIDWSTRLFGLGVRQALVSVPGFNIEPQSGHSAEAIDLARPIVKCCNAAYQTQRVWRKVRKANVAELWSREALERLVGPCQYLVNGMCIHHACRLPCAYLDRGFVTALDPDAAVIFNEPPVLDLKERRNEHGA